MLVSYTFACAKKGRIYSALGGVALVALLNSSSLLYAAVFMEEQEEASRVRCLWHLGEKPHRLAVRRFYQEGIGRECPHSSPYFYG